MSDDENYAVTDTSQILMSDVLKNALPTELTGAVSSVVIARLYFLDEQGPRVGLCGSLQETMISKNEFEVQVKLMLDDALEFINMQDEITIEHVEFAMGETIICLFKNIVKDQVVRSRIHTIDKSRGMCSLLINVCYAT